MITIKRFIAEQSEVLAPLYGAGEARSMLLVLLEEYLSCSRSELLLLDKDTLLSSEVWAKLEVALSRLRAGEPLQYILGYAYFFDQKLEIAPGVLIPRPETEELVYLIKQDLQHDGGEQLKVLDVGTGSACIPSGLASQVGSAYISQIDGIDFSPEALCIAQRNVESLKAQYRTIDFRLFLQDVFKVDVEHSELGGYDLIVSNPPYIHPCEAEDMTRSVLDWEPSTALFTPEDKPMLYYDQIARLACTPSFLREGGRIYLEINPLYAELTLESMLAILSPCRRVRVADIVEDMSNKQRFIRLIFS